MNDTYHPTDQQAALYSRLLRQYGHTSQWEILTKARRFERMTPHRAAHFIARLFEGLTGDSPSVPCGCTGSAYAAQSQKHPDVRPGAPAGRSV